MKIVLDTNVLVSGMINPDGPPGKVLDLAMAGEVTVYIDARIESEYHEVLSREGLPLSIERARTNLATILEIAVRVTATPLHIQIPDPDDLKFIEVAVAAGADCIVTGNKRHFPKRAARGVPVLSPFEFMQLIGEINKPD
jgi:putative PIN family toxin of toxin-antitoxin system